MSGITDELRAYADSFYLFCNKDVREELNAIADRIDAEHVRAVMSATNDALYHASDESMAELGWVRLPVDVNGVPWHIGDRTENGQTIQAMGLNGHGWHFVGTVNDIDPSIHHHAPTVEDVLREFWSDVDLAVADCGDPSSIIAEYAAKLREVMAE